MSRFLAFAHPVETVEEARQLISRYTNQYHDARHVCWAYTLGADRSTQLSTDNGEPSGTAGKPIQGQITSAGLTNIIIIVVRYFGGIKLGTSGLIAAYRQAAAEAIAAATIIQTSEMTTVTLTYAYPAMEHVMRAIKRPDITILTQNFDNTCTLTLRLPLHILPEITPRLTPHATIT